MKPRVLTWLVCPLCRGDLTAGVDELGVGGEVETGAVTCAQGHRFPVISGVPRLLPQAQGKPTRSIKASFSREWAHFDYEVDRTWGQTVAHRRKAFLRHVDLPADWLAGKLVLDAGCGNGVLSAAVATFGCEVVATDISESVEAAHRHLGGSAALHFVQSDLQAPAARPGAFDVVYCAGVLHHTPNTRTTFGRAAEALAPGGTMFVWLYWDVPGFRARLSEHLRRAIAPLPAPVKHAVVWALLPQTLLRERLRTRSRPEERLNRREHLVRMLDSYTPRYRWRHTPDEVGGWFEELGLTDVHVTEEELWGFGIVARRPAVSARSARTEAVAVSLAGS